MAVESGQIEYLDSEAARELLIALWPYQINLRDLLDEIYDIQPLNDGATPEFPLDFVREEDDEL